MILRLISGLESNFNVYQIKKLNKIMDIIKRILIIGTFLFFALQASAQMVAVKSDVLKDAMMIPNITADFTVGERHTLGVQLFGASKIYGNTAEIIGIAPSFRYWISGRPLSRFFIGVTAQAANYTINWKSDSYHGNSLAAGLNFGYVFNLSTKFNIEVVGGTDLLYYSQKEYRKGDAYINYGEEPNSKGTLIMPRLEVALQYVIR